MDGAGKVNHVPISLFLVGERVPFDPDAYTRYSLLPNWWVEVWNASDGWKIVRDGIIQSTAHQVIDQLEIECALKRRPNHTIIRAWRGDERMLTVEWNKPKPRKDDAGLSD